MGTAESILGQATTRILTLLQRARLATFEDAENAVNVLFRRLSADWVAEVQRSHESADLVTVPDLS
jgi:precorrin-6x reductase